MASVKVELKKKKGSIELYLLASMNVGQKNGHGKVLAYTTKKCSTCRNQI